MLIAIAPCATVHVPTSIHSRNVLHCVYSSVQQGDASAWVVDIDSVVIFEQVPGPAEFLAAADVRSILECGLIPTFDRYRLDPHVLL